MQQFILNYTRKYSDNKPHFSFIDTVRFNSSALEKIDLSCFNHKLLFRVAKTDAIEIVGSSGAGVVSELDDHIIRYTNGIDSISFRPFLHKGLEWDGWKIGNDGKLDLFEDEEYLL